MRLAAGAAASEREMASQVRPAANAAASDEVLLAMVLKSPWLEDDRSPTADELPALSGMTLARAAALEAGATRLAASK